MVEVDFSYQVRPFSLIIALLAGAAGMLSLTSANPACWSGCSSRDHHRAGGRVHGGDGGGRAVGSRAVLGGQAAGQPWWAS
jgi:hypothetical protein